MELTRETTAIVLDSTSDFVDARERHENMRIVPLYVLFDGEPLRDQVDIGPGQFYERLAEASSLPTTSQPTPADFLACYEELVGAGYTRIWSIHLTSKLSGTYESAVRAAEQLGRDIVKVVDTETASLACALLAEAIDRRLERGTNDEEIEQLVERFLRGNGVVFTVGTLEYLQKGGRIGKGQALAGSLLNVKPILSVAGRRRRPGRPRPREAEGAEGVRAALHRGDGGSRGPPARDRARERAGVDRRADRARDARATEGDDRPDRAARRRRRDAYRARLGRLLLVPGLGVGRERKIGCPT